MEQYIFNSIEYQNFKKEIDKTLVIIDKGIIISEEGFGSFSRNILLGTADIVLNFIGNTFRETFSLLNIGGLFNAIVRNSPVEDFLSHNKAKMVLAWRADLDAQYSKLVINKPRGMATTYVDVLSNDEAIFKTLNMTPFIKSVNNDLDIILALFSKKNINNEDFFAKVSELILSATANEENLFKLSKKHDEQFSGPEDKFIKSTVEKEFGSIDGFKDICYKVVDNFKYIRSAKEIKSIYDKQSSLIRLLIEKVEKNPNLITKEILTLFVKYLKHIASCYQLFGALSISHMAMENNIVITLNEMLRLYLSK